MDLALLDSDMLSEFIKARNLQVLDNVRQYLQEHGRLAFSAITFYEIERGFHAAKAARRLADFRKLADDCEILPISMSVLQRAALLWAAAHEAGHPRNDAALIVASCALEYGRVLVTGNTGDYSWIPGLVLQDWPQPLT